MYALPTPSTASHDQTTTEAAAPSRRIYNPIQRDAVTFLETAEETSGARSLLLMDVAPGGGNALHYHKTFTERFTVVSGTFGVQVDDETFVLQAGQSAVAPAMSLHRWYNTAAETATVRVELLPGNSGFEDSLRIAYGLARDGLSNRQGIPRNPLHLALLIQLSDTALPGLFTVLTPVMRVLAKLARRTGVERTLMARYCRGSFR